MKPKPVKASRSKPKEAKASKSQLEFKFKISSKAAKARFGPFRPHQGLDLAFQAQGVHVGFPWMGFRRAQNLNF